MTVSNAVVVPVFAATTVNDAVDPACNPAAGEVSVLVSARNGSPTVTIVVDGPRVAVAPPAPGSLNDSDALLPSDVLAWFDRRLSTIAWYVRRIVVLDALLLLTVPSASVKVSKPGDGALSVRVKFAGLVLDVALLYAMASEAGTYVSPGARMSVTT